MVRTRDIRISDSCTGTDPSTSRPSVKAAAEALKGQYAKVGAIGYCWGGWAVFQLASDPALVDVITAAHPAMFGKEDIDKIKVPVQLIAPEEDFTFTPELKQHCLETLPKTGVQWRYDYYAGYKHGFASRGDPTTEQGRAGLERAKRSAVSWFAEFLH
jgi:dienelactone hydrolase